MYKHIVFDVDGTLIDTEYAILHSLQDTLKKVCGKTYNLEDLDFALGITGAATLKQLNVPDIKATGILWNEILNGYKNSIFDGIEELLQKLSQHYTLGIVTSKTREEFEKEVSIFGLNKYFGTIICADDTFLHKPNPEPLLKYLELSGVANSETLYIGDSIYDLQCAKSCNVDFAFAKWGNKRENLDTKFPLTKPLDLLMFL